MFTLSIAALASLDIAEDEYLDDIKNKIIFLYESAKKVAVSNPTRDSYNFIND